MKYPTQLTMYRFITYVDSEGGISCLAYSDWDDLTQEAKDETTLHEWVWQWAPDEVTALNNHERKFGHYLYDTEDCGIEGLDTY